VVFVTIVRGAIINVLLLAEEQNVYEVNHQYVVPQPTMTKHVVSNIQNAKLEEGYNSVHANVVRNLIPLALLYPVIRVKNKVHVVPQPTMTKHVVSNMQNAKFIEGSNSVFANVVRNLIPLALMYPVIRVNQRNETIAMTLNI